MEDENNEPYEKSYFQCYRCFYKCYQLNDIKKHLNKKVLCTRSLESYKYKDEELNTLSLKKIIVYTSKILECKNCNKFFSNKSNLNRHLHLYCKNKKEEEENEEKKDNSHDKNNITNNCIINIINNNTNIDNSTNNIDNIYNDININVNIHLLKSFDEKWNIDHIDDKVKLILLLNNSKFTSTLENILENEVNLNVLIDKTSDVGLVYNNDDKSFNKMNIKDIVRKSMDKLFRHLCDFKKDIIDPNIFNINKEFLENEFNIVRHKYNEFKNDKNIQDTVNKFITDIYNRKKNDTLKIHNQSFINGY
jgi:hypothetical protein